MSAFSRGIGLGLAVTQRIFSLAPKTITIPAAAPCFSQRSAMSFSQAMRNSPIIQAARNLQTTARLRAPKPTSIKPTIAKPAPPLKARPAVASSSGQNAAATVAVAARLAKSATPTILYESPSHFWFHLFSLATATFCVTYALMHYYYYVYNPPKGWSLWLPWAFGLICLAMLGMATYFVAGTTRIVRRITAVPKNLLPKHHFQSGKGKQTPEQAHSLALLDRSPVAIEVTLSQLIPLLPAKKVIAAPSEVWLAIKMQDMIKDQTALERAAGPVHEPDPSQDGFLDKLADSVQNVWIGAKRALTKGGFVPMKVKGDRYRLDVTKGAKVLGDGKVVDRLLPCFPDRFDDGLWSRFLNN